MKIRMHAGRMAKSSVVLLLLLVTGCVDKPDRLMEVELGEGVTMKFALIPAG